MNISGYSIQSLNTTANEPQEIAGPGRAFEVLQPGVSGNRTLIQAIRERNGAFSDDQEVQAYTAQPGVNVCNFDKLRVTTPRASQMKIKLYTAKTVATVDTGPDTIATRVLWATNTTGQMTGTSADPFELTQASITSGADFTMRTDGMQQLRYSDRSNITTDQDVLTPNASFGQVQSADDQWWSGWITSTVDFTLDVYAASYVADGTTAWTLVQSFNAIQVSLNSSSPTGVVPADDATNTFATGQYLVAWDAADNKTRRIPTGSLRVFVTGFGASSVKFRGVIAARASS